MHAVYTVARLRVAVFPAHGTHRAIERTRGYGHGAPERHGLPPALMNS